MITCQVCHTVFADDATECPACGALPERVAAVSFDDLPAHFEGLEDYVQGDGGGYPSEEFNPFETAQPMPVSQTVEEETLDSVVVDYEAAGLPPTRGLQAHVDEETAPRGLDLHNFEVATVPMDDLPSAMPEENLEQINDLPTQGLGENSFRSGRYQPLPETRRPRGARPSTPPPAQPPRRGVRARANGGDEESLPGYSEGRRRGPEPMSGPPRRREGGFRGPEFSGELQRRSLMDEGEVTPPMGGMPSDWRSQPAGPPPRRPHNARLALLDEASGPRSLRVPRPAQLAPAPQEEEDSGGLSPFAMVMLIGILMLSGGIFVVLLYVFVLSKQVKRVPQGRGAIVTRAPVKRLPKNVFVNNDKRAEMLYLRGLKDLRERKWASGIENLTRASTISSDSSFVSRARNALKRATREKLAQERLEKARLSLKNGKVRRALAIVKQIPGDTLAHDDIKVLRLKINNNYLYPLNTVAIKAYKEGKFAQAIDRYRRLWRLDPTFRLSIPGFLKALAGYRNKFADVRDQCRKQCVSLRRSRRRWCLRRCDKKYKTPDVTLPKKVMSHLKGAEKRSVKQQLVAINAKERAFTKERCEVKCSVYRYYARRRCRRTCSALAKKLHCSQWCGSKYKGGQRTRCQRRCQKSCRWRCGRIYRGWRRRRPRASCRRRCYSVR